MKMDVDWAGFRRALLRGYRARRREMPWRAEPGKLADPYAVLVSEVMLQQTQVATVVGYFQRFMEKFPTLGHLAAAQEREVLHAWQGLGYYRRARLLHRAAQAIVGEHGGKTPQTLEELLKLPGVGRYTAGAIASIAFDVQAPVVDGNVARVLGRVMGIEKPVNDAAVVKRLWEVMGRLVQTPHPGDLNQAVMELGATVCVPKSPRCSLCPVSRFCGALAAGEPERFGVKGKRAKPREVIHRVLALRRGERWLFQQRPERGLWADMWQMPTVETGAEKITDEIQERLGLIAGELQVLGSFIHVTTHRRIRFEVAVAQVAGGRLKKGAGVWRLLDDLHDLPMSNAQKRAVEIVRNIDRSRRGGDTVQP